jgi:hypothetical protein
MREVDIKEIISLTREEYSVLKEEIKDDEFGWSKVKSEKRRNKPTLLHVFKIGSLLSANLRATPRDSLKITC